MAGSAGNCSVQRGAGHMAGYMNNAEESGRMGYG